MTMPNFLIVGAMKSGTTALYYYLEKHPQIYMSPVKEPNFFCLEGREGADPHSVIDIEAYRNLFKGVSKEKVFGEASHCYLYEPAAIERIKHHVPRAKFIAILRNPIDRAYSHFLHMVRNGTEPLADFVQALREEEVGSRPDRTFQDYIGIGLYHRQVKRYFDTFGRDRTRVYLYEDLNKAPLDTLQDASRFLGVDDSFVPDVSLRRNVSGQPKHKALDRLLRRPNPVKTALKLYLPVGLRWRLSEAFDDLKARNLAQPEPLPREVRQQLVEVYREDVRNLEELIDRDLSGWLA
jgi:sulfotransferase family protein